MGGDESKCEEHSYCNCDISSTYTVKNYAMVKCLYYYKYIDWDYIKKKVKNKLESIGGSSGNITVEIADPTIKAPTKNAFVANKQFTKQNISLYVARQQNVKETGITSSRRYVEIHNKDGDQTAYGDIQHSATIWLPNDEMVDTNKTVKDMLSPYCQWISDVDYEHKYLTVTGEVEATMRFTESSIVDPKPFVVKKNMVIVTADTVKKWQDFVTSDAAVDYMLNEINAALKANPQCNVYRNLDVGWRTFFADLTETTIFYNIPIGAVAIENTESIITEFTLYGTEYELTDDRKAFKPVVTDNYLNKLFNQMLQENFIKSTNTNPAFIILLPSSQNDLIDIVTNNFTMDKIAFITDETDAKKNYITKKPCLCLMKGTIDSYEKKSQLTVLELKVTVERNKRTVTMTEETFNLYSHGVRVDTDDRKITVETTDNFKSDDCLSIK